jgi:hypothetical protein
VLTITEDGGARLVKVIESAASPIQISFTPDERVRPEIWEELGNLLSKKNWPRHPNRFKQLYQDLKKTVAEWPERLAALKEGYAKVDPSFDEQKEEL